jgi:hypothetical protein
MSAIDLNHKTLLITGACGVTSRTVVRALRMSPAFQHTRLIGTDICDNPFPLYEGLYERIYRVPRLNEAELYQACIQRICNTEHVDAAIVVPEPEVLHWARNYMPVPALLPPPRFCQAALSKGRVYQLLKDTGLVPDFEILTREEILDGAIERRFGAASVWLRDVGEGSTSGKGAIHVHSQAEAAAWMTLNPGIPRFMASGYLPGRNLACLLLYVHGEVRKIGCYERLEYFMAKTVVSGVSGNISKGRLINDPAAVAASRKAIDILCRHTGETMHGLVTVDLRTDEHDAPRVTEINLRQVAAASAFAHVPGANLTEAQALVALGHPGELGPREVNFPPNNRLFRDIDGLPVFVADYQELAIGQSIPGQCP